MKGSDNGIVELNVGGSTYTTTLTTLNSYTESMLCRMVSNGNLSNATDTKERIFIDRDGPLFRYILNFLRDKQLNLPENFAEYAQLYAEADFYRIEPIMVYLEKSFHNKLNLDKNTINSSVQSVRSEPIKLYFTVISKLHQGTVDSITGCLQILNDLNCLESNSKRFIKSLLNSQKNIDTFICEFKFMHDERIICCKPCGLCNGTGDSSLINISQFIFRTAKKYSITTGYWDDMFYLTLSNLAPNRELLASSLNQKYNAKLLSSSVSEKRVGYKDETSAQRMLIERWYMIDPTVYIQ